jgi:aminoglycoside N3'-acetyltransferase
VHLAEERVQAPYRYWKEFPGRGRAYRMFVRDLDRYPELHMHKVEQWLLADGALRDAPLGGGRAVGCSFRRCVDVVEARLRQDPWALVRE